MDRGTLYALESLLEMVAIAAALTFGVSFLSAFFAENVESWRTARVCLQTAVVCAVLFVILNIVLPG